MRAPPRLPPPTWLASMGKGRGCRQFDIIGIGCLQDDPAYEKYFVTKEEGTKKNR